MSETEAMNLWIVDLCVARPDARSVRLFPSLINRSQTPAHNS